MFITNIDEIKAYLPTTVWQKPEGLLSLLDDTEETYLVPLLGRPLFNYLQSEYKRLTIIGAVLPKEEEEDFGGSGETEEGGGVADSDTLTDKEQETVRILRICQAIDIYMTLANNSGILNVSINSGGGMNSVTTDGYDHADKDAVNRFEKDAYMKAHRAIDRLLIALEEDACNPYASEDSGEDDTAQEHAPYFSDLWKRSRYFYRQHDTLFTTAAEFNRYVNVDRSRELFITLQADIRYCQDTYLCPEVGTELVETLVASLTDPSLLPAEKKDLRIWQNTIARLRTALALYTEARNEKLARKQSRNEADLSLARAKTYISEHQESFGKYILDSPLYVPSASSGNDVSEGGADDGSFQSGASGRKCYDPDDPNNAILTFPYIGVGH